MIWHKSNAMLNPGTWIVHFCFISSLYRLWHMSKPINLVFLEKTGAYYLISIIGSISRKTRRIHVGYWLPAPRLEFKSKMVRLWIYQEFDQTNGGIMQYWNNDKKFIECALNIIKSEIGSKSTALNYHGKVNSDLSPSRHLWKLSAGRHRLLWLRLVPTPGLEQPSCKCLNKSS